VSGGVTDDRQVDEHSEVHQGRGRRLAGLVCSGVGRESTPTSDRWRLTWVRAVAVAEAAAVAGRAAEEEEAAARVEVGEA